MFIANLLAFLKVLPDVLKLIDEIGAGIRERQLDKWFAEQTEAFKKYREAQKPDERMAALRQISSNFRDML